MMNEAARSGERTARGGYPTTVRLLSDYQPNQWAETPRLTAGLMFTGMVGVVTTNPNNTEHSMERLFRRYVENHAALNSLHLLSSGSSGETTGKTELLKTTLQGYFVETELMASRVHHLMCYAGRNDAGEVILLNLAKPAFSNVTTTPYLLQTTEGHLVLNQPAVAKSYSNFVVLEEDALPEMTGQKRHAVNFMVPPEVLDANPDIRLVIDPHLVDLYFGTAKPELHLIEMPLGQSGRTHSVVMPLEFFLAFVQEARGSFPHLELNTTSGLTTKSIGDAMTALKDVLEASSIQSILKYNDKRPILASFNAFANDLSKELVRRNPYIPLDLAKRATINFVRHFFAVEYSLIQEVLSKPEEGLEASFEKLRNTEFAKFLIPVSSLEEFKAKIKEEQKKKAPPIPFEFSSELSKSDTYLSWLSRIGKKIEHAIQATKRSRQTDFSSIFSTLKRELLNVCKPVESEAVDQASLDNTVNDFIDIIFGKHKLILEKIVSKIQIINTPDSATDPATSNYWKEYWRTTSTLFTSRITNDSRREIIEQLIRPDVALLFNLPLSHELFGQEDRFIESIVNES